MIPRYTPSNGGVTGYHNLIEGYDDLLLLFGYLCELCCTASGMGDIGYDIVGLLEHLFVAQEMAKRGWTVSMPFGSIVSE